MYLECVCENCGKVFRGKKYKKRGKMTQSRYCSEPCKREAERAHPQICSYCGEVFRTTNGHDQQFCSMDCRKADTAKRKEQERIRLKATPKPPKPTAQCEWCGGTFSQINKRHRYCCNECMYNGNLKRNRDEYIPKPAKVVTCKMCGEVFTSTRGNPVYCSKKCANRMEKHLARERGYSGHRGSNHYLSKYPEVFERDGGICQLCGLPIVPDAEILWHGSLDHIKPQSNGGTDDVENLRLAHVICNSIRQNYEEVNRVGLDQLAKYQGPFQSLCGKS